MGERFYLQQLKKLGSCPGYKGRRKRRMAWTPEKREEVVAAYEAANPTKENSTEIVKEIADDVEESVNGVRMILIRAGVYVKTTPASKASTGGTRVSKAAAQESLTAAIQDAGQEPDEEIISKLTGKAAVYLAGIIKAINT
jgi:hypothetical protein